jgi:hypothetical protein
MIDVQAVQNVQSPGSSPGSVQVDRKGVSQKAIGFGDEKGTKKFALVFVAVLL